MTLHPSPSKRRTRSKTTVAFSFASFFFILFALICLCPAAVQADSASQQRQYGTVIGIDLGTTYSCVGVQKAGRIEIIANDQGSRITPSWVSFKDDERLIGEAAKNAFHHNPSNTVFDAKRLIGRTMDDPTIKQDIKHWPFRVQGKQGKPLITVKHNGHDREFSPEEISAMVLTKMKETAEAYLGEKVTHAVVTVPAYFNDAQRQATKDAGAIAGLTVLRVINEPTAAALAYGLGKKGSESKTLVYDLGGGTFDVSLLSIEDGVYEVLATAGDTHLGGEDFDNRVIEYFVKRFRTKTGNDVSGNTRTMAKLKKEVEKAKRVLSSQQSTRIELENFDGTGGDLEETLTRAKFEELNIDLFKKTFGAVEQVLKDAKIKKEEVDEIVLVGGSTRIPKVQQMLKDYFGKELSKGVNPDEAVAYGAAIQGGILGDAGLLTGEEWSPTLIDINALTLGIETTGGIFAKVIQRGTPIPVKKSQIFSTATDNQSVVSIKVYEGERTMCKDNNLLGSFELSGIPPAPRGVPQIEVTFNLDANSIMTVSATDKATGKTESVTIKNEKGRLSQEEIDRMILEGEKFAEQDRLQRERVESFNSLSSFVFSLKTRVNDQQDLGGKLNLADLSIIRETVAGAASWIEEHGKDASIEDLEGKLAELTAVVNPITAKMYQTAEAEPQQEAKSEQSHWGSPGDEL
ncbi:heat shock protein 70 [Mycena floridula]|nr:heat shock protein 70 [Mycena floridula]